MDHVVATGDIESQQHVVPIWLVDHMHMLRPNREEEVDKLGYVILKVPEWNRQPPEAFSPLGWRFGLHNRANLDSSGSEAVKLDVAVSYGLVGEKWIHFRDAVVDDPQAMLACYGLQGRVTNWTDEQVKHVLALDALFLAAYIDVDFPSGERRFRTCNALPSLFHKFSIWWYIVRADLYRFENQIPFSLIDKVVEYVRNQSVEPVLDDLQYQQRSTEYAADKVANCFMDTSPTAFRIVDKPSPALGERRHILGAAYRVICGPDCSLMNQSAEGLNMKYVRVPSATKLEQSGIQLVGAGGPLCTMSYKKKCLRLPKMRIYDETMSFIRNMAWYELHAIPDGCLFHDYIHFMVDLVQAPEDLDLLLQRGVVENACGSKGFEMWAALQEGLIEMPSSQTHHDVKEAIVSRCGLRRYRLWSEFKTVFCSKPWVVLSTIAVVLVTTATLVQTYVAIIGSNKMKPEFP